MNHQAKTREFPREFNAILIEILKINPHARR
jgi:hypothetical protein